MIGSGDRKRAIVARISPFKCSDCKMDGALDRSIQRGKNCTLRLFQPDQWTGCFLPPVNLGLEGDATDPEPLEPLADVGCPAGYHRSAFVASLAPYRPQRYGQHFIAGRTSDDPLVADAIRTLALYVTDSHDRYQKAVVYG